MNIQHKAIPLVVDGPAQGQMKNRFFSQSPLPFGKAGAPQGAAEDATLSHTTSAWASPYNCLDALQEG